MKVLELYSGTECMSNAFRKRGHECFTIDWDEQFPSSWHTDIGKVTPEDILERFGHPDVIWIGTDCTTYSIAAISHHRRKNPINGNLDPVTDYAKACDERNVHCLWLINQLKPKYWFIENPRGGLRSMTFMRGLPRYTITYCQYGGVKDADGNVHKYMKPTDIWTNHPDPQFKPPCHNGDACHEKAPRGSRNGAQGMKNNVERSKYPEELCEHIVDICERGMQMYNANDFKLNDIYYYDWDTDPDAGTVTYFYDCPVSFLEKYVDLDTELNRRYTDLNKYGRESIVGAEIAIEKNPLGYWIGVAPVAEDENGNASSIDWFDIDIDDDLLNALLAKVEAK